MELSDAEAVVRRAAGGLVRESDSGALDALYRSLPALKCRGKCASACGPVPISPLERQRIVESGFPWVDGRDVRMPDGSTGGTVCCALEQRRLRCRVYESRPMICRLWGLVESLACPWGCAPEGGHLDDMEGLRLMNLALWHGGSATAVDPARWDSLVARPQVREAMLAYFEKPVKEEVQIVQGTIRVRPGL
ncbi:YkgJ family cysteine cluster protein [Streptomyces sp. NPDC017260]|uniref:YkgJ family cysteine cluster protein n=1 Tax=unclassified Streptomyces TaxID=2593676 RepID=UPI003788831D